MSYQLAVDSSDSTGWYTVGDVAKKLRISTSTVYSLVRQGKIKALRVFSTIRIRPEDVDVFIDKHFTTS